MQQQILPLTGFALKRHSLKDHKLARLGSTHFRAHVGPAAWIHSFGTALSGVCRIAAELRRSRFSVHDACSSIWTLNIRTKSYRLEQSPETKCFTRGGQLSGWSISVTQDIFMLTLLKGRWPYDARPPSECGQRNAISVHPECVHTVGKSCSLMTCSLRINVNARCKQGLYHSLFLCVAVIHHSKDLCLWKFQRFSLCNGEV